MGTRAGYRPAVVMGTRAELLRRLAEVIESARPAHPVRVAIDGPPAAGKTTLADEFAVFLRSRGREVIRASTDGFHRVFEVRWRSSRACY